MIHMEKNHHRAILIHAEESYPQECCGFLLGKAGPGTKIVSLVRRASNIRKESSANRYRIPPEEVYLADKDSRLEGLEILGFYHSHPDTISSPSEYDRSHAWPWYTYLIVPVAEGRAGPPTAWVLQDLTNQFAKEPLNVRE